MIGVMLIAAMASSPTPASARPASRPPSHQQHTSAAYPFDSRLDGAAVGTSSRVLRARITLGRRLGHLGVVEPDAITGTLRFVGRLDGFLTPPGRRPAAEIALGYVGANLGAFGLSPSDLQTLELRRDYVDILGTHHLSWIQRAGGVPVFGAGLQASVTADGRLVNVTGPSVHAPGSAMVPARIGKRAAIAAARLAAGGSPVPIPADSADRVLFPTARGTRLAWRTVTRISDLETDMSIVDATTGDVLWRANLTRADSIGTGQAVEYYPGGEVPAGGGEALEVTFPVIDGTALSGNNAHVYSDVNDDDTPDPADEVPAVSGLDWSYPPVFDTTTVSQNCSTRFYCTWDSTTPRSWRINRKFFGVQLFHFLNVYHDHLQADPIGFTEAAGNFQVVNASGQGLGGDPVEGQFIDGANLKGGFPDGSHVNNANMTTLPDGEPGVMQMYLQRKASWGPHIPTGDSGNEAETVYHEYTHGLSDRLVTYPDGTPGLNAAQSGAMGEGWSDWYAVDFTDNQGYFFDTPAAGDAIIFRYSGGDDIIFRYDAIDCPVDATTAAGCAGTDGSGPGGFTYGDYGNIYDGPEVHSDGEIWVQTLWDIRAALGASVTESIVTRAMELSPPDPSFLDMRNAIVQADLIAFGGAHVHRLWQLFADRGMGYFAAAADGGDPHPIEDFSVPPTCGPGSCGSISGTVTDSESGVPIAGVRVFVPGQASGFANDLADTTDADGSFSIANVPFHDYPEIVAAGSGYEPFTVPLRVDGAVMLDAELLRDWAALETGARLVRFTPPDYAPYCGAAADGAFDLSIGSGWPSDAPANGDSGVTGPRSAVVRLPQAIDVTSFGVASGGTCGDSPDAGVKRFTVQIRSRGRERWVNALTATTRADAVLRTYVPDQVLPQVRMVRFIMRSNHGDPDYMDVLEVTVRGTP